MGIAVSVSRLQGLQARQGSSVERREETITGGVASDIVSASHLNPSLKGQQ